jgi:hypothetical protein
MQYILGVQKGPMVFRLYASDLDSFEMWSSNVGNGIESLENDGTSLTAAYGEKKRRNRYTGFMAVCKVVAYAACCGCSGHGFCGGWGRLQGA